MTPKEEQKQNLIDMMQDDEKLGLYDKPKQTAVEWLVEQLFADNEIFGCSKELLEQAKQMEKEQMCKFAYKCHNHYKVYGDFKIEQYYNETYDKSR